MDLFINQKRAKTNFVLALLKIEPGNELSSQEVALQVLLPQ